MQKKIDVLKDGLSRISQLAHVGDIRQKGFMAGIEIVKNKDTKEPFYMKDKISWKICDRAREKGLLIRPLGNVIVLMPPLSISHQELKSLTRITGEAIKEATA